MNPLHSSFRKTALRYLPVMPGILALGLAISEGAPGDALRTAPELLNHGLADSALAVVSIALRADSGNVALWLLAADIHAERGRNSARVDALHHALRFSRRSVTANLGLADAFLRLKKPDSAYMYAYAAYAQSNHRSPEACFLIGCAHEDRGQLDSALVYYHWAWDPCPEKELLR